jgi:hypothetical protein
MPRDGSIIFGDLIGKLGELRVECPKCGGAAQYRPSKKINYLEGTNGRGFF